MAPSMYNTQPWAFSIGRNTVRIYPDHRRSLPIADPTDTGLYVALGCALENILIGVGCYGMNAEVEYLPEDECPEPLLIHFSRKRYREPEPDLLRAIPERQTIRSRFRPETISSAKLSRLAAASPRPGVRFELFTDSRDIRAITDMAREAIPRYFANAEFVQEMRSWLRFDRRQAEILRDGLDASVMGFPAWPKWPARWLWRHYLSPQKQAKRLCRQAGNTSAFMLVLSETNDAPGWVNAGRSLQRVLLTATELGIRCAPIHVQGEELGRYLGLASERPIVLARLGYAEPTGCSSVRRPPEAALVTSSTFRTAKRRVRADAQTAALGPMMGTV